MCELSSLFLFEPLNIEAEKGAFVTVILILGLCGEHPRGIEEKNGQAVANEMD